MDLLLSLVERMLAFGGKRRARLRRERRRGGVG